MKNRFSALLVALLTFGFATSTFAQYDDLYSIPSDDAEVTQYEAEEEYVVEEATDHDEYDEYSYLDDQDYYYSSRIRRFNRTNSGFGYYSPFFTDIAYYNAAYSPGASIYLGNPFNYNVARRALRSPFRGYGFNSAYSPFFNPYNVAGFGGVGGFNSFNRGFGGVGGFGGNAYNAYCPPTSYGNNLTRTSRGANNAIYGPRGTSTTNSSSRSNDSSVRRGTSRVIRSAQGNDGASSRSRSTSTRANTNTRTNRTYDRSNRSTRRSNATRGNNSNRRSYSTPRSSRSSRSISSPRRSSSRSISAPRSSSSRSSFRSSSSSRRQ